MENKEQFLKNMKNNYKLVKCVYSVYLHTAKKFNVVIDHNDPKNIINEVKYIIRQDKLNCVSSIQTMKKISEVTFRD